MRGEVDPGPGVEVLPPPQPSEDIEDPVGWIERSCRVPSGPRRGELFRLYGWQRSLLAELDTRVAVLRIASQAGKTALMLASTAHRLRCGSPVLVVAPDEGRSGLSLARRRVETQVASCPELAALAQVGRAQALGESGRATLRTFSHGASYEVVGAQSPAGLAARDVETITGDELARWPLSCGGEGDPVLLAVARSEAFRATRRILLSSTPTTEESLEHRWFEAGDCRRWFVPCVGCGASWSPTWGDVDQDVAAIRCPSCGHLHHDGPEHHALVEAGEWRATRPAPDPNVTSYTMPRWLSPASRLVDVVADRAAAERTRTVSTWTRLAAAEPAEPDPEVDLQSIQKLLVPHGAGSWPPAPVQAVACGVDLQANRVEVLTLARLENGLLAVLDYSRFYGRPGTNPVDAAWGELREHVRRQGARVAFVDSSWNPDVVRWQYRRNRMFIPVKGASDPAAPAVARGRGQLILGVTVLKGVVLERLAAQTLLIPAWPTWRNEFFLRSLLSETEETTPTGNRKWRKVFARNEAFDCAVYAAAALEVVPTRPRAPLTLTPLAA